MASPVVPMTPCLVVLDPDGLTEEGRATVLDPKGDRLTCDIEPLGSNMRFSLTWKGWILSSDRNDFHTFLYDPMTSEKIELPNFAHDLPRVFECALSDKPTNNGCIVVILHPTETCFWYCRIGGGPDEWVRYDYDVGVQQCDTKGLVWEKIVITNLTSCKGKFYSPNSGFELCVIEFNPRPVTYIVTMRGLPRGYNACTCFFELDEELYQFYVFKKGVSNIIKKITLYKVDLVKQRFVETDEIGDRALLWSGYGGGCCPATRFALEPNCVYWIKGDDNSMHVFNIVENTKRVCYHPSQDLPKLFSEAFWLLPSN